VGIIFKWQYFFLQETQAVCFCAFINITPQILWRRSWQQDILFCVFTLLRNVNRASLKKKCFFFDPGLVAVRVASSLHQQRARQVSLSSILNCYRRRSYKAGARPYSNLVSIRFLSGFYQGYRTPTQHFKENIILLSAFGLLWISWRIYLDSQVYINKILDITSWFTLFSRLFRARFPVLRDPSMASAFQILSSLKPNSLPRVIPSTNSYACDWCGKERTPAFVGWRIKKTFTWFLPINI
jgi:hypothetical protein